MELNKLILDRIDVTQLIADDKIIHIVLGGSRGANGNFTEESDYDICILFHRRKDADDLIQGMTLTCEDKRIMILPCGLDSIKMFLKYPKTYGGNCAFQIIENMIFEEQNNYFYQKYKMLGKKKDIFKYTYKNFFYEFEKYIYGDIAVAPIKQMKYLIRWFYLKDRIENPYLTESEQKIIRRFNENFYKQEYQSEFIDLIKMCKEYANSINLDNLDLEIRLEEVENEKWNN